MQIHEIKRTTPNAKTPLIGRGGKRGKTSGRGTKGQNARAGRKKRPELRDFIKRVPKLRGYAFKSIEKKPVPVSLEMIEKVFKADDIVKPETLVAKGLVEKVNGVFPTIKILSDGEITKKIEVYECKTSKTAKEKIEKAGGKVYGK